MVARILVIGAGSIGTRHAANLAQLGADVTHAAYRSFDPQTLDLTTFQGIVIATQTQVREDLIALAARHDLPFYVEKPLDWRPGMIARLHDLAAPVAARSMVGLMMRYHPAIRALAARDLSDIYGFSLEIGHDVRRWRPDWRFTGSYAARPDGGGVLLDLCHEIDIATCLLPDLALVACDSLGHAAYPGVDFASRLTLSNDHALGQVAMDYLSPVSIRRLSLRGTRQTCDLDLLSGALTDTTGTTILGVERNEMFLHAMADFLALATGRAPSDNPLLPRFDRVRASCALIAAAHAARAFRGRITQDMDG